MDFSELPADGIMFEQLVRELLVASGFDVHWTGVGADNGRDLVVWERAEGALAAFERKWVVSCKHKASSRRSVGVDDVVNISDICAAAGATGFLLVCSTQPSASVVQRLEEIRAQGRLMTKFWDSVELEKRLSNPNTIQIANSMLPKSSRSNPWKLYATNTPSLWLSSYHGYLIYLSSRTSHAFPELVVYEGILRAIERIVSPEDYSELAQFLRPRAIHFSDRLGQLVVYVDYIFDIKKSELAIPKERLETYLLRSTEIYVNEDDYWQVDRWDLRYFGRIVHSDKFELDDKEYYEEYAENFKYGTGRDGSTIVT